MSDMSLMKEKKYLQQVKRNKDRFPDDFMFKLTEKEVEVMVSQNVIPSKQALGGHLAHNDNSQF